MNGHNLFKMMWNMMTHILWMNSFVYAPKTAYNKKMPDQACANGLQLHDIQQDLENIIPLERRVISPRIPFITILIMRQYCGHYKVNGPPVNVPATLDQIIDILPCMPSDLQLHPIKLKCKLEYKSHYMHRWVPLKPDFLGA